MKSVDYSPSSQQQGFGPLHHYLQHPGLSPWLAVASLAFGLGAWIATNFGGDGARETYETEPYAVEFRDANGDGLPDLKMTFLKDGREIVHFARKDRNGRITYQP